MKETDCHRGSSTNQKDEKSDSDGNDDMMRIDIAPKEQWDCESILSKCIV